MVLIYSVKCTLNIELTFQSQLYTAQKVLIRFYTMWEVTPTVQEFSVKT